MVTTQRVQRWVDEYRRAWEESDDQALATLFTDDARYTSLVFADAHIGHEGIGRYLESTNADRESLSIRLGRPIVGEDRAAVEFWATMVRAGEPITIAGCLVLEFEEGLCRSAREYWNETSQALLPASSWGI